MALLGLRKCQAQLPETKLYLDEVEEISSCLLEAFSHTPSKNGKDRHIVYTIDDTDVCDTVADLQETEEVHQPT